MSDLKKNGRLRWAPSYLRRQGQMTPAQKRAYREHWSTYGLEYRYPERIDLAAQYDPALAEAPLHLEIGFGMGENLVAQALQLPEQRFLGVEVHKPGLGAALKAMTEQGVTNLRLMRGDARLVLTDFLHASVRFARVSILFPDPWPNDENAHRRIVQHDLLDLLETRVRPDALLHIATDVDLYAEHCRDLMQQRSAWLLDDSIAGSDLRVPTRYEGKGIAEGRRIHDLVFRYRG